MAEDEVEQIISQVGEHIRKMMTPPDPERVREEGQMIANDLVRCFLARDLTDPTKQLIVSAVEDQPTAVSVIQALAFDFANTFRTFHTALTDGKMSDAEIIDKWENLVAARYAEEMRQAAGLDSIIDLREVKVEVKEDGTY